MSYGTPRLDVLADTEHSSGSNAIPPPAAKNMAVTASTLQEGWVSFPTYLLSLPHARYGMETPIATAAAPPRWRAVGHWCVQKKAGFLLNIIATNSGGCLPTQHVNLSSTATKEEETMRK